MKKCELRSSAELTKTLANTLVVRGLGLLAGLVPCPPTVCATTLKNSECPFEPLARFPDRPGTARTDATSAPCPASSTLKIVEAYSLL